MRIPFLLWFEDWKPLGCSFQERSNASFFFFFFFLIISVTICPGGNLQRTRPFGQPKSGTVTSQCQVIRQCPKGLGAWWMSHTGDICAKQPHSQCELPHPRDLTSSPWGLGVSITTTTMTITRTWLHRAVCTARPKNQTQTRSEPLRAHLISRRLPSFCADPVNTWLPSLKVPPPGRTADSWPFFNMFRNLCAPVTRWSASCVNWASCLSMKEFLAVFLGGLPCQTDCKKAVTVSFSETDVLQCSCFYDSVMVQIAATGTLK